jgi:hypothetical protein
MKSLIRRAKRFFVGTEEVRYENHKEMNETAEIKNKRHYQLNTGTPWLGGYSVRAFYELSVKTDSGVELTIDVNKDVFEGLKKGDRVNLNYQIDDEVTYDYIPSNFNQKLETERKLKRHSVRLI